MPLIVPSAFQNPLAYPAGRAPGFDPTHPLMGGGVCRVSAIASGANVYSLLTGAAAVSLLSPTATIDSLMGPAAVYTAANARSTFASTNINDTTFTVAGIFSQATIAAFGILLSNATGVNGYEFLIDSVSRPNVNVRGVGQTGFTQAIAAGVPYFCAISARPGTATGSLVLVDLRTGVTRTQTGSNVGTAITPTGSLFTFGNRGGGGLVLNGRLACVAQTTGYLSPQQLLAVAADPWSFWYPQDDNDERDFSWATVPPPTPTPPPVTGVNQFLVGGPDITEQFVTFGRISAVGLSYTINPLSRKTVGGTATASSATFDVANTSITAAVLSNGNKTYTAEPNGFMGTAKSLVGVSSGKKYFEGLLTVQGQARIGISGAAFHTGTGFNETVLGDFGSVSVGLDCPPAGAGSVFLDGGVIATLPTGPNSGGTACVAFDVAAQLIWFRVDGSGDWNGSPTANPATGTGGLDLNGFIPAAPFYAYVTVADATGGTSWTINFGGSAFAFAAPAGFTGWGV